MRSIQFDFPPANPVTERRMNSIVISPVTHQYLDPKNLAEKVELTGPFLTVEKDGRTGLRAASVHSRVDFPAHNLNDDCGFLTMWVLAADELTVWQTPQHATQQLEPNFKETLLLADAFEEKASYLDADGNRQLGPFRDPNRAHFAIAWSANWYPQLLAKMHPYAQYEENSQGESAVTPNLKAVVSAGHWHVQPGCWYQLAFSWHRSESEYRLFVNGVQVGASMQKSLQHFPSASGLRAGSTVWALSDLKFYGGKATAAQIEELYDEECVSPNEEVQKVLRTIYLGENLPSVNFTPDASWEETLACSFCEPEDLGHFQAQGFPGCYSITSEGLEIRTPSKWRNSAEKLDISQGYLWTRQFFRGDLFLEYEFMPLKEEGLSLLCLQAAGMQGEDFMQDYPLRIDGSMQLVYGENVRLYHWEYFREMDDTYFELASHGLFKQPWCKPMAYQCQPTRLAQNTWHKLQFVQEGVRLRGMINGLVVFDVEDNGHDGCGPVFRSGRLAIRCMFKTHLRIRNLRVCSRSTGETLQPLAPAK